MNDDTEHLIDTGLLTWASETQAKYLHAVNRFGGYRAAARGLGLAGHSKIVGSMQALARHAAARGYAPDNDLRHTAAPGFLTKRVSTYYRATDETPGQWHIQEPDKAQALVAIKEWLASLTEDVRGLAPIVPAPAVSDDDLMVVIPMGDPHFGMYAWKDEAGEDFDLDIAERITKAAVDDLVRRSPPAATGVLLNLGDMFHADTNAGTTTKGTPQDVDGRSQKVMQVGLRTMNYCVLRMLEKFSKVIVRNDPGNHDENASFALAIAMDCYFHNEPRVTVDLSPAIHWYLKFGKVMIGSTHGDKAKMEALPGIMFTDQRRNMADVEYCYWYCGHIHTSKRHEATGCVIEYFRTLAPGNAWSTGAGYRAGRDMNAIVLHREYGEWDRMLSPIRLLEAA